MSQTTGAAYVPLSPGFGYGIILGLGFAFALGMIGTTWALKRYHGEVGTVASFFNTGVLSVHPRSKLLKLSQLQAEQ